MLHKFFEPGDWFAPKKLGYGAGLPITWQGWVLLIGYIAVMGGLALLVETGRMIAITLGIAGMVLATIAVLLISKARTKGGWKWRP